MWSNGTRVTGWGFLSLSRSLLLDMFSRVSQSYILCHKKPQKEATAPKPLTREALGSDEEFQLWMLFLISNECLPHRRLLEVTLFYSRAKQ